LIQDNCRRRFWRSLVIIEKQVSIMPSTIELSIPDGEQSLKQDSVTLATVEELFAYIAPGGDCEKLPSDLSEIQMILLSQEHPNVTNPLADRRVTLQLGLILITGPMASIVQVAQELIDKMGRGELSEAFLAAAGVRY
jgi:hypothetical protein